MIYIFASFSGDNTPYSCLSDMILFLDRLKEVLIKYFLGLKKKILKENADKCYLITSSKALAEIEVSNITIMDEERFELLESYTDNKLNFDYHISELRKNCML